MLRLVAEGIPMSERLQQQHYDRILAEYEAHYDDACSRRYRARFFCQPLFAGLDLRGRRVLEAMCGSGQTTEALQGAGARVVGLDLSHAATRRFRERHPEARVLRASFLRAPLADGSLDGVVVAGGMHHLHPRVPQAFDEIHRVLRPGGFLAFIEPHDRAFADRVRRFWYRRDRWFEENEASLDLEALKQANAHRFRFELERYGGNVAYYAVLNSLILRVPLSWKPVYTPLALWLEERIARWQGPRSSSFVLARWWKV